MCSHVYYTDISSHSKINSGYEFHLAPCQAAYGTVSYLEWAHHLLQFSNCCMQDFKVAFQVVLQLHLITPQLLQHGHLLYLQEVMQGLEVTTHPLLEISSHFLIQTKMTINSDRERDNKRYGVNILSSITKVKPACFVICHVMACSKKNWANG